MATAEVNWREEILTKLQKRNKIQTHCFQDLIAQHNKIFDNVNALKHENLQLSIQNEKLRVDGDRPAGGGGDSRLHEKIQILEQKLLSQQEELTELHRRKGENSQQIIDLNAKLQEKEKFLMARDISLAENAAKIASLQAEIALFDRNNKELNLLNEALRDEHQALHLAFTCLEDKMRKLQDENRQLLDRLMKYKTKDADRMNEENENFLNDGSKQLVRSTFGRFRKRFAKMQKEIEEACRDTRGVSPEDLQEGYGPVCQSTIPTKASVKFDAHDGEVNAVKWSPVDRLVATGGADRKVKLWEISKGACESKGMLVGSNAGVMAVDFDASGTMILGASNDYASRVWTVADQRLRSLQRLSVRPELSPEGKLTLTDIPSLSLLDLRRCQINVHKAMMSSWAERKTAPATIKPAMFMQTPDSLGMKMASDSSDLFASRSKPNLSVIWMDCTRSRSSWGSVERRRRRRPYDTTERRSPEDSSWSHCTGSQVGMQGVTSARNCTTSEEGNLKASKCDNKIWKFSRNIFMKI
ncbi:autophagy-related protein 16-1 isoform X4 [Tribolium castaneum]|uniref:autophagy-related protein 16-1 isoform X4 n=1 Tax=Tribolium castaneum TaxID=7070 RepID=UPI0030FE9D96